MILDALAEQQIATGKGLYVRGELDVDSLERWIQGALDDWVARGRPEPETAVWGEAVVGETVLG